MVYQDFKNKHRDSKIIVCGCGESALLLKDPSQFITIGVNDIERLFCPNYLVILNDKSSFTNTERWHWVENAKCNFIFTHIKALAVPEDKKIIIALGRHGGTELDKPTVDYTSNSPYVGVILAHHLGATKIGLLGVDFTLNHFFAKTGEHVLSRRLNAINQEYQLLHSVLKAKNVELFNLSPVSKVDIPKMNLDDFAKL